MNKHDMIARRDIKIIKNERTKVKLKCKENICKWMIFTFYERNNGNFIVKKYKRKQ